MIFSTFFKPKWQHKDRTVRIQAIADELSLDNPEHFAIISQLVDNDDCDLVRQAALVKLNNFDAWLSAYRDNSVAKVREFAGRQVTAILQDKHDSVALTKEQKLAFLAQAETHWLENWLTTETDSDVCIALCEKIGKPQLLVNWFQKKTDHKFQCYVVEKLTDISSLEKLLKKVINGQVAQRINEKLSQIVEEQQRPEKLAKQIQLLLSKLLALKEIADYAIVADKKAQLLAQWQSVEPELDCFSEEQRLVFTQKYQRITEQLEQLFAVKAEQYKHQQMLDELARQQQELSTQFEQQLRDNSQALSTAIFENSIDEPSQFEQAITLLQTKIAQSVLSDDDKTKYEQACQQQLAQLQRLPEVAQGVASATQLISKISQLAVPQSLAEFVDRELVYRQWLAEWSKINLLTRGILPESILSAYQQIAERWQHACAPFINEQKALFAKTRKKLTDVNRLVAQGKYNASFGVFKKVQQQYQQLTVSNQQRLERDYQQVSEKIAELSDWEHYIATPRKQSLLAEIQQLAAQPLADAQQQAEQVKMFRRQWNTLGHADDAIDAELNQAFNEACEQAFEPCRSFYAVQEAARQQHLQQRNSIINQLEQLANSLAVKSIDWKEFDGKINKLQHRWKTAGDVERSAYKSVQDRYNQALKPLKNAVKEFHQQNAHAKQQLLSQAEQLLTEDNLHYATDNLKGLQQQWRLIGYAGPREEKRLWQKFRVVNDQLFAQRDVKRSEEHQAHEAQHQAFNSELNALLSRDDDLLETLSQLDELHGKVLTYKPVNKPLIQQIESQQSKLKQQQEIEYKQAEQRQWQAIFTLCEHIAADKLTNEQLAQSENWCDLSNAWQKRLIDVSNAQLYHDRQDATLELEVLAGKKSPAGLQEQRMAVQVRLMQEHMTSGTQLDFTDVFTQWLGQAALTKDDLSLLARIKPVYCH